MKCTECEKGELVKKNISETVEIEGGPTLKVCGISALVCNKCGDYSLDLVNASKSTHLVLAKLVAHYGKNLEIPGKVAKWMRDAIGLKLSDWAEKAGVSHSTLSVAATRNTMVDRFSSFVLLCLVSDFISGTNRGAALLEETLHMDRMISNKDLKAVELEAEGARAAP